MLFDADGKVLSFPPIINSNDLGKVTEESRNLLVEVTGTLHKTVLNTLNLVTAMLIDRGGKAYHATIHYPEGSTYTEKTVQTPDFSNRCVPLSVEYTNKILGLNLTGKRIAELLQIAGLNIQDCSQDSVSVLVPFYRIDVMHQVDLIEDVAIAYGYNNIEPNWRELPTIGRPKADQHLINLARDLMVGLGYQEILNYTLTNQENLFDKMNVERGTVLELSNPKVVTMTCLRNWLLPGLVEFLSINQSVEFPQKLFELGKVTLLDERGRRRCERKNGLQPQQPMPPQVLAKSNPRWIPSLATLALNGKSKKQRIQASLKAESAKSSLLAKKSAFVGEVSPQVLEAWKLENPMAAFEINFQRIIEANLSKSKT